jgi:hypothetical protein
MKFGTVLNVVKHFVNGMFFFIADATAMHVVHRFGKLAVSSRWGWGRLNRPSVLKYKESKFLLSQNYSNFDQACRKGEEYL